MKTRSRAVFAFVIAGGCALAPLGALAQQPPYADRPYGGVPPVYVVQQPAVPGWAAGAMIGSRVGMAASLSNPVIRCAGRMCTGGYNPGPVLAGALLGGLIGQVVSAATAPPPGVAYLPLGAVPVPAPAVLYAAAPAPTVPAGAAASAQASAFTDHWQRFAAPAAGEAAGGSGGAAFAQRWQSFAEPYATDR